jgi:protein subunit release factor B
MNPEPGFQTRKLARLAKLGLDAGEFEEKFARASGPGGQHVNKVSTAVTLRHPPTGLAVTAQDTRSQSINRQLAWERMLDTLEKRLLEKRAAERHAREKARRQTAKKPWGVKQRMLDSKRRRSDLKKTRSKDW